MNRQQSSGLRIRRAETRDVPRILELLLQVNNVHHEIRPDLFLENETKYSAEELAKMLQDQSLPIFVAENSSAHVVGYLFAQIRERKGRNLTGGISFYLDDLCVDAACRASGVGQALLEHAKDYARKLGCRELLLNAWEGNDTAIRFYANRGFTPRSYLMEYCLEDGAAACSREDIE